MINIFNQILNSHRQIKQKVQNAFKAINIILIPSNKGINTNIFQKILTMLINLKN
jgi:hypothetical protein